MPRLAPQQLRTIGFNDSVESGKRSFHVQTEVLVRDGVAIRTTVLEAGAVRFAESRRLATDPEDLGRFSAEVEAQHRHFLHELEHAGATWLESISRTS